MRSLVEQIGIASKLARRGPRRVFTLPVGDLRPVIRIAHRPTGHVVVPERVIFDHEFVLFLRGRGEFHFGRRRFEVQPHSLFLIRPYEPHTIRVAEGITEHVAVHFDLAPGFPSFAHNVRRRPPYAVTLSHGQTLPQRVDLPAGHPVERCLIDLVAARASAAPTGALEAATLLMRALLLLMRMAAPPGGSDGQARNQARVQRAVEHIHARFTDELTTPRLARVAGLSPTHFVRLFERWTGQSPADYVRQVRIARARTMLADVDLSIKEIAARTGFKTPFHFSRVFRQVDGLAPTLYREAALAGRT